MKNLFIFTSLALLLGFSVATAAAFLGLISASFFSPTFFVSAFTTSGILAIMLSDYSRRRRRRAQRVARAPRTEDSTAETALATWGCGTYS